MDKKLTAQGPKGRKSYTVTLPLDWVKAQKLDLRKLAQLEVIGNKIVISAEKQTIERETVDLNILEKTPAKVLQALYRRGVTQMKILYKHPKQVQQVMGIVNTKLIGCEVIEQSKGYLIIKDITQEVSEDFETILRRVFLLILELMVSKEREQVEGIEDSIQKLVNYCLRTLVKRGHLDYQRIPFYFLLLDRLEKISDEFSWVLKQSESQEGLKEIQHCMRKAYELYYRFDPADFDTYAYKTYQMMNAIRQKNKLTVFDMHVHNLARQLNTIYSTILALRYNG